MNPDKSHGCKWDLKAASADVPEAIDKTALFSKALLSLSPSLSLSLSFSLPLSRSPSAFGVALLQRCYTARNANLASQIKHVAGKAVCEPIGIVFSN